MVNKKPYISVIVATTRIGGLDILCSGLEQQTFKDFELVFADNLYEYRKDIVKQYSYKYSFPIKHIKPNGNDFTAATWCRDQNTALINASGHIAFFVGDYTWLESNCLQVHADFHKNEKPNVHCGLICSFTLCKLPKLHKDFYRPYADIIPYDTESNRKKFVVREKECFIDYVNDLNNAKLNSLMWSIFDEQLYNPKSLEITETRISLPEGITDNSQCFLRNESFVLDDIFAINGFNEELDGTHGWQDWEFIDRSVALLGTRLYSKSNITAINVNPRNIMYCRNRSRGVLDNEMIWKRNKAINFSNKINAYSLIEQRNKIGLET